MVRSLQILVTVADKIRSYPFLIFRKLLGNGIASALRANGFFRQITSLLRLYCENSIGKSKNQVISFLSFFILITFKSWKWKIKILCEVKPP